MTGSAGCCVAFAGHSGVHRLVHGRAEAGLRHFERFRSRFDLDDEHGVWLERRERADDSRPLCLRHREDQDPIAR